MAFNDAVSLSHITASREPGMPKRKRAAKRPHPRLSKQKQGPSRKLATVVLTMVVRKFDPGPGGRLIVAIDDSPTEHYGKHVEGAGAHHDQGNRMKFKQR